MDIAGEDICARETFLRFQILPDLPYESERASMSKLKAFMSAMVSLALFAAPAIRRPAHAGGNLAAVLKAEIATLDHAGLYLADIRLHSVRHPVREGRKGRDQAADGAGLEGFA